MKSNQSFAEFQTIFLHLAGEGEIPVDSLRLDLYDKLTTQLQERLAAILVDLDMYKKLTDRCMSLDTELKRINAYVDYQKHFNKPNPELVLAKATASATPGLLLLTRNPTVSTTPTLETRRLYTPALTITNKLVTCFNCQQTGHMLKDCTEPRRIDLKEVEEDKDKDLGKDYTQEKTLSQASSESTSRKLI